MPMGMKRTANDEPMGPRRRLFISIQYWMCARPIHLFWLRRRISNSAQSLVNRICLSMANVYLCKPETPILETFVGCRSNQDLGVRLENMLHHDHSRFGYKIGKSLTTFPRRSLLFCCRTQYCAIQCNFAASKYLTSNCLSQSPQLQRFTGTSIPRVIRLLTWPPLNHELAPPEKHLLFRRS